MELSIIIFFGYQVENLFLVSQQNGAWSDSTAQMKGGLFQLRYSAGNGLMMENDLTCPSWQTGTWVEKLQRTSWITYLLDILLVPWEYEPKVVRGKYSEVSDSNHLAKEVLIHVQNKAK